MNFRQIRESEGLLVLIQEFARRTQMQPRDLVEDLGGALGLVLGSAELTADVRAELLQRAFERARGTMEILSIIAPIIIEAARDIGAPQSDTVGRDAVKG